MSEEKIGWRDEWYKLREDYSFLVKQLQSKDQQIKELTELYELARHMAVGYTISSAEKHDELLKSYQQKYPKP